MRLELVSTIMSVWLSYGYIDYTQTVLARGTGTIKINYHGASLLISPEIVTATAKL